MSKPALPATERAPPKPNGQDRSASQHAYERLRSGILMGEFVPGAFIEESVACAATGVSRTPVREALARLGAEGFLELHPRRGAMVKPISTDELFDLYDVRLMLETHAVRRICRDKRPVPESLDEMCDIHDEIEEGNHLAFADLNHRFHETIVAASGNKVLLQVFQNLRANLTRVAMLSFQLGVPKLREGAMHRALVKALRAHDEAAAMEVTERHLSRMPRLVASLPRAGMREPGQ